MPTLSLDAKVANISYQRTSSWAFYTPAISEPVSILSLSHIDIMLASEALVPVSNGFPASALSPPRSQPTLAYDERGKPLTDAELPSLSAGKASCLMRSGQMTAQRYILSLLSHINQRDGHIQAWVFLDAKGAINQAKTLDELALEQRGPLHGVPVGIKDIIAVKGTC
jgi:hypothetical protein